MHPSIMCFLYIRLKVSHILLHAHTVATAEDSPIAMKLKKMWLKTPVGEEQAAQAIMDPSIGKWFYNTFVISCPCKLFYLIFVYKIQSTCMNIYNGVPIHWHPFRKKRTCFGIYRKPKSPIRLIFADPCGRVQYECESVDASRIYS